MPAKRKLVEVYDKNHRQLQALKRHCRHRKAVEPSIPFLVNLAVELALPQLISKFWPTED